MQELVDYKKSYPKIAELVLVRTNSPSLKLPKIKLINSTTIGAAKRSGPEKPGYQFVPHTTHPADTSVSVVAEGPRQAYREVAQRLR
jgi:hypothetical protein